MEIKRVGAEQCTSHATFCIKRIEQRKYLHLHAPWRDKGHTNGSNHTEAGGREQGRWAQDASRMSEYTFPFHLTLELCDYINHSKEIKFKKTNDF